MSQQKTVRMLKTEILKEARVQLLADVRRFSQEHDAFVEKLNKLGWSKQPETCDDVDATAFLSDEQYDQLLAEFRSL